jgi:hypothetical protein
MLMPRFGDIRLGVHGGSSVTRGVQTVSRTHEDLGRQETTTTNGRTLVTRRTPNAININNMKIQKLLKAHQIRRASYSNQVKIAVLGNVGVKRPNPKHVQPWRLTGLKIF